MNLCPLLWEHGVLTIGPPGKSHEACTFNYYWLLEQLGTLWGLSRGNILSYREMCACLHPSRWMPTGFCNCLVFALSEDKSSLCIRPREKKYRGEMENSVCSKFGSRIIQGSLEDIYTSSRTESHPTTQALFLLTLQFCHEFLFGDLNFDRNMKEL